MLVCVLPWLAADEFLLKDGRRLVGQVIAEEGTQLTLRIGMATLVVERSDIVEWIDSLTPEEEYARRASEIPSGEVEARIELADWCRTQRLRHEEEEQLRQILLEEPDHEQARHRLGYVRDEAGNWAVAEELWRREAAEREDAFRAAVHELELDLELEQSSLSEVVAAISEASGAEVVLGDKAARKLASRRLNYSVRGRSLADVLADLAGSVQLSIVYDFSEERVFVGLPAECNKLRRDLGLPVGMNWTAEALELVLKEHRVAAKFEGVSLLRALEELEERFELPLVLDGELTETAQAATISYNSRNQRLGNVLKGLLRDQGWEVVVMGGTLFITTQEQALRLREEP